MNHTSSDVKHTTRYIFNSICFLNQFELKLYLFIFFWNKSDGVLTSAVHKINFKLLKILLKPDSLPYNSRYVAFSDNISD